MKTHIRARWFRGIILSTFLFAAVLPEEPAQAETIGLCNFDAFNNTGQCADNFELFLGGIGTNDITWVYNSPAQPLNGFPNVTLTAVPGGTLVSWTGNTNCGTNSHFGVTIADCKVPTATNLPGALFTWTSNGIPIGTLPSVWQTITLTNPPGAPYIVGQIIVNGGVNPIFAQRLLNQSPTNLVLGDLMPDGPIYANAVMVDTNPVMIPPGGALTNEYVEDTNMAAVVPIFNVFANSNGVAGPLQVNYMEAVNNANGGGLEPNTLHNYSVTNNTGEIANDFETFLGGITNLDEISSYWTVTNNMMYPGYPDVSAQLVAGGALITWTGSRTLPGHYSHFGVEIGSFYQPAPQTLPAVEAWWTAGGTNIGYSPVTWPIYLDCGSYPQHGFIINPFPDNVMIQRRINFLAAPPNLEDLTVTSPIWLLASNIDVEPVLVPPGGALTNDFPADGPMGAYVLGYDLYNETSSIPDVTFISASATARPRVVFTGIQLAGTNVILTTTGSYEGFRIFYQINNFSNGAPEFHWSLIPPHNLYFTGLHFPNSAGSNGNTKVTVPSTPSSQGGNGTNITTSNGGFEYQTVSPLP
jgi:hypothetical protein